MRLPIRLFLLIALTLLAAPIPAAERVTYFVPNAQGSPVAAMDEQGAVIWREHYAPYGDRLTKSPDNNASSAYAGKPEDQTTGLVYMGSRWHDPETARFTGIDPQGFKEGNPHSFGRYVYANNTPYRYVDPNGESPVDVVFLAYDAATFATAVHSGNPVAMWESGADLTASFIGVLSPVPGTGELIKVGRVAGKVAEGAATSKRISWPPNRGFEGDSAKATLIPGAKVDRYGDVDGSFVSPDGTPFPQRSLPESYASKPLNTYEVMRPIDADAGPSAPWFDQPGKGMQFELPGSVRDLLGSGHLRDVTGE